MTPEEPDFRTDRVALKIDRLIPELQALLDDLRAEVDARRSPDEQDDSHASD